MIYDILEFGYKAAHVYMITPVELKQIGDRCEPAD